MDIKFNKTLVRKGLRFILVGGGSTLIDYLLYMLLSNSLAIDISKIISMLVASVFSFFANKKFTFRNREKTSWIYWLKYYLVFALNLLVNVNVNSLIFKAWGIKTLAFIIATGSGMCVNFFGQYLFVFRDKEKK